MWRHMEMQGHFSPYASVPINRPDILADIPAMLFSSTGPLALKWNYVPKMIPWAWQFIKNCTSKKNDAYSNKYASNFRLGPYLLMMNYLMRLSLMDWLKKKVFYIFGMMKI